MSWKAVVEKATGRLHSYAEEAHLADPMPPEFEVVDLPEKPDWDTQIWDPALRTLAPKPVRVRAFTPAQKQALIDLLSSLGDLNG